MKPTRRSAPLPAALLLVAACATVNGVGPDHGEAPPPRDGHLRTGASSYELVRSDGGWATTIDFTFTNPLAETIYVVNCRGGLAMELQRWDGAAWRTVWSPALLMCLSPPIEIGAGETYAATLPVWGSAPGRDHLPEFATTQLDGTYRLKWDNLVLRWRGDYVDGAFGDPVPEELRVSDRFELRRR